VLRQCRADAVFAGRCCPVVSLNEAPNQ
jgi:hypothetical protein